MSIVGSDNFDRADQDPMNIAYWSVPPGCRPCRVRQLMLQTSLVQSTPPFGAYWNDGTFLDDQYSQAVGKNINNDLAGPAVRIQTTGTAANGYVLALRGTTVQRFYKCVNGVWTKLGADVNHTINTEYWAKLEAIGTDLNFHFDGDLIATRSDATFESGAAGFLMGSAQGFDDWEGGNYDPPAPPTTIATKFMQFRRERA